MRPRSEHPLALFVAGVLLLVACGSEVAEGPAPSEGPPNATTPASAPPPPEGATAATRLEVTTTLGLPTSTEAVSQPEPTIVPAPPEESEVAADGRVSWNIAPAPDALEARRYLVDYAALDEFPPTRFETPVGSANSRTNAAILSVGSNPSEPNLYVLVTSPEPGTPAFDPSTLSGEPVTVAGETGVKHPLGVAIEAVTFVVDGRRIDVHSRSDAGAWLLPVADSFRLDGDRASVVPPPESGLRFVGAFSPLTPVLDGESPFNGDSSSLSTVSYGDQRQPALTLTVSLGRYTDVSTLIPWLDSRGLPTSVAGTMGWVTEIPQFDVRFATWFEDGRQFNLWVAGADEATLLRLAELVRPATPDEWSAIPARA